jgi:hypothetical protein
MSTRQFWKSIPERIEVSILMVISVAVDKDVLELSN